MLSCIFAGLVAGKEVPRYLAELNIQARELPSRIFSSALAEEEALKQELFQRDGGENVHKLHEELSSIMVNYITVKRNNRDLEKAIEGILQIKERLQRISLDDKGSIMNQTYQFASQFSAMIEIALVIAKGALLRDEFRGSHYKPEFPLRDDKNWLKTTIATYSPRGPIISYVPVDTRHLQPIARDYTKAKKVKPTLENIPKNIELPV